MTERQNAISQIVKLMRKLNLNFGGIDLALVDDTYYFIESQSYRGMGLASI